MRRLLDGLLLFKALRSLSPRRGLDAAAAALYIALGIAAAASLAVPTAQAEWRDVRLYRK